MTQFDITQEEAGKILHETILPEMVNHASQEDVHQGYILEGQPGSSKCFCKKNFIFKQKHSFY